MNSFSKLTEWKPNITVAQPRPSAHLISDPSGLKEIQIRDYTGRIITEWEGSPRVWLDQFCSPKRRVVSIRTK
jgi:hypothetical protein